MAIERGRAFLCTLALAAAGCGDDPAGLPVPDGNSPLIAAVAMPERYGLHDTFVRDGIAFTLIWDDGVRIYDVGNGIRGGTPAEPALVSQLNPETWGNAHNAWWFHNPNGERRYLFVGEEGPRNNSGNASGDIHVLDVSDLANPIDVASFTAPGAGTHNFWMDETAGILYAAYYNEGVIALDVSGELSDNLADRELGRAALGGAGNRQTWGVQLAGRWLYAIDMLTGLWQLDPGSLAIEGGGNNVPERLSSDLWVHGEYVFTGTYGYVTPGNAVKIWQLDAGGAPTLVDSIVQAGIGIVSDVEVSPDGTLLMYSAENGPGEGVYWYDVTDPRNPRFLEHYAVSTGIHTATFAEIGGRLYAFGAKNPSPAGLLIFDVTPLLP